MNFCLRRNSEGNRQRFCCLVTENYFPSSFPLLVRLTWEGLDGPTIWEIIKSWDSFNWVAPIWSNQVNNWGILSAGFVQRQTLSPLLFANPKEHCTQFCWKQVLYLLASHRCLQTFLFCGITALYVLIPLMLWLFHKAKHGYQAPAHTVMTTFWEFMLQDSLLPTF